MARVKSEIKKKLGNLGGTFDPSHKGHIKISNEAKKRYKLNEIMDGDLTEVIEALQLEEQKAAMEDL